MSKFLTLAFLVGSALCAGAAESAPAQTNAAVTLTLRQALETNVVGSYRFSPAWTGKCAVVVATGAYNQPESPVRATNRYDLKFDTAVITPRTAVGKVGPRALAEHNTNGGYRALHTYRESLPADGRLRAATTRADLERLLGPPHGFPTSEGQGVQAKSRLEWWFFSLGETESVETLQVSARALNRAGAKEAQIDSLEIVRGKARPEIKPPKKKA